MGGGECPLKGALGTANRPASAQGLKRPFPEVRNVRRLQATLPVTQAGDRPPPRESKGSAPALRGLLAQADRRARPRLGAVRTAPSCRGGSFQLHARPVA